MEERRQYLRVERLVKANYKLKGQTVAKDIHIKDLSLQGLGFCSDIALAKGTVLEISIKLFADYKSVSVEGYVVWQSKDENNNLNTGVKFAKMSTDDETRLSDFIKNIAHRVEEKRKFIRCSLAAEVKYSFLDKPGVEYFGKSDDISKGGMKAIFKEEIKIGSKLKLSFILSKDKTPILVEGQVTWSRKKTPDGTYNTGIFFTNIKPEDRQKISDYLNEKILNKQ